MQKSIPAPAEDEIVFDCFGPFGCFTIPTFRTERFSYDVPTPSACVGLLKQIYWHPSFDYECVKIEVFNEIRRIQMTTNELTAPVTGSAVLKYANGETGVSISVPRYEARQQRSTNMLKDVYYRVTCKIVPSYFDYKEEFDLAKARAIVTRRIQHGQMYRAPYFGMRECLAYVRPVDARKTSFYENKGEIDLGTMLYDVEYIRRGEAKRKEYDDVSPHFYHPVMKGGIITVPDRREVYSQK